MVDAGSDVSTGSAVTSVKAVALLCRPLKSYREYESGAPWISPTCGTESGTMTDFDCGDLPAKRGFPRLSSTWIHSSSSTGSFSALHVRCETYQRTDGRNNNPARDPNQGLVEMYDTAYLDSNGAFASHCENATLPESVGFTHTKGIRVQINSSGPPSSHGIRANAQLTCTNSTYKCSSLDDTDGDGTSDCDDLCPADPNKTTYGYCNCGVDETVDLNSNGIPDCAEPTLPNASGGMRLITTNQVEIDGIATTAAVVNGGDSFSVRLVGTSTSGQPINKARSILIVDPVTFESKACVHNSTASTVNFDHTETFTAPTTPGLYFYPIYWSNQTAGTCTTTANAGNIDIGFIPGGSESQQYGHIHSSTQFTIRVP